MEEFVKLQMERQKFFVVCTFRYASDVASNVITCRVNAIPTCFPESVPWFYYTRVISRISSENEGFDSGIISYSDFISAVYRTNPIKRPSPSLRRQEN